MFINNDNNNNSNENNINNNTYDDYYDNNTNDNLVYTIESSENNHTTDFVEPGSSNTAYMKTSRFILALLAILSIIMIIYNIIDAKYAEHDIKFNLTSVGLLQTKLSNSSYQLNFLITPSTGRVPKFKIHDESIISFNNATSYVTSAKAGETIIDALDLHDNESVKSSIKICVVNQEIKLEDFIVEDMTIIRDKFDMITITPVPYNSTEINYNYESTDTTIATVSNGIVKGVGIGEADIIIKNNNIVKTIHITVK